ncbi:RING finger and WD repeat domain-containing protein 2 [Nowakowskiella sp. JEL0078]|nr:RING finger and WD repeat domain-containing protein 2 [Nowakowskiella sp. JEL0078]
MVTASTDSTLRLWSLKDALSNPHTTGIAIRQYSGHTNEKNFVGMDLNCNGEYFACGSESNSVYGYFWKVPKPVVVQKFGNANDSMTGEEVKHEDPSVFVSSITWRRTAPNILLAANSQGRVKVMELV